jgi:hypothetical protein
MDATLLDQQCWTIVGQRVQTDATIQQLLAVQLNFYKLNFYISMCNQSV